MGWKSLTYSLGPPYPNPDQDEINLSSCTKTTANQIYIMRDAWQKNLTAMMAQEKPASEMVDEGFESIRTYRCWLDYLCEAVLYSANADPKSTLVNPDENPVNPASGYRPLTSSRLLVVGDIDGLPGCASSDKVQIPGTQIQYLRACQVGSTDTVLGAQGNYAECRDQVEKIFSCKKKNENDDPNNAIPDNVCDPGKSPAFIALQATLKGNSAQQVARPLRDKFSSILLKMAAMEGHMSTLVGQVESLDLRLPCYAEKCD